MELIFFTKSLKGMDVEATGREVMGMGLEGLDLAVRPGYCVNPDNVASELPRALAVWADMGLSVPMVTTPGDFTDPTPPLAEVMLAACGEAGIHEIKLGYWLYQKPGYWAQVDSIRHALEGFQRLAEKHGVRVAVHTHSDAFFGLNASAAMHLVKGFDPRYVGVYLDPGHLSINGEPIRMAVDIAREHLCLVAVKAMLHVRREKDGQPVWRRELVPLREGLVNWDETLRALRDAAYDGPLTFHSEYENVSLEQLRALTRDDVAYIRGLLGGL
ncbi:MAG TPA: TIM barrel protein [Planctomycetota bacterium]|nr:TIM barrel protein [Planctomycetota bacterium]HRR80282.1 TIM barrel protein [Planctomycetota bacterium]HRT95924.1 TIM barrel protein [Planctomycetota bacterium]